MASKASVRVAQPAIPSPSVAAGTLSPRSSPGGMHLNATKSLVSAVQELKAATSAVKELSAAAEKISPTTSAAGDVTKKASKITDGGLGITKKSSIGLVSKFAEDDTDAKKSPAGSAAKIAMDTVTPGSPVKSPTAATLASEVAKTLSVIKTAEEAAVPSKASLSAVGAAPLIPVPSLAAGTIQTRPSNATTEVPGRKKSSSSASSSSSETRRKRKVEGGEKKMSEETARVSVKDASVTSAAAGSKSELNPAIVIPGSKVNVLAMGSVIAGSKAALGSKQNLETSTLGSNANIPPTGSLFTGSKALLGSKQNVLTPGSNANIPPTGSLFTGSKALLGSKQNVLTATEEETQPEVEITTTEVRPLPDEYATADTTPRRKL